MNNILVDTNVFIYYLDNSSQFFNDANNILEPNANLYTTTKNISELFAVTSKIGIDLKLVFDFYADFKKNITTLFPNEKSLQILTALISDYAPKRNRIFDFEIASIMLANDVKTIATFNLKDFTTIPGIELFDFR